MDILSIRKKAKEAAKEATKDAGQEAAKEPATSRSTSASTSPATAALTDALPPMPAPQPPQTAAPTVIEPAPPAMTLPPMPATQPTSTAASTTASTSTDPLSGFLAAYDADEGRSEPVRTMGDGSETARRFLSFRLVDEDYAASIMDVREILTIRSLTEVPRAPREVLGVVSKRGVVLPVIDLATSLGLRAPERRLRASQRVLVVGDGDRVCGLRVDSVAEVIRLQTGQIEEVPASLGQKNAGLLLGLGRTTDTMYILLDVPAVLDAFALSMGIAPAPRAEV